MLKNYLKIAWRNLLRNKTFTAINVFGLSVAFGVSLLLFLTGFRELSYDNFHEHKDRLFRVVDEYHQVERGVVDRTMTPAPLQPVLEEQLPGVIATRYHTGGGTAEVEGVFHDLETRGVDPGFFRMFTFPLLQGDPVTAIGDPSNMVLSQKTAQRLFGTEDVMGRTLTVHYGSETKTFTITGIAEDHPDNSSINFQAVTSIRNNGNFEYNENRWDNIWHETYVLLPEGMTAADAAARMQPSIDQYHQEEIEQLKREGAQPGPDGRLWRTRLQPITDVHYGSTLVAGSRDGSGRVFPIGLLIVGVFILSIACINFINLTLGTSLRRSTEIGVRKVVGASRRQVAMQFWTEALLVISVALVVGIILAYLALPHYNALFGRPITLWNPNLWLVLGCLVLLAGLLGGGYPGLVLSRFQLSTIMKKDTPMQKPGRLRHALIVLQFTIAIALICCTIIVQQQLEFFRNKPLGFNQHEVVSIPIGSTVEGKRALALFRQKAGNHPNIQSISGCYSNFGLGEDGSTSTSIIGFEHQGRGLQSHWQRVDYDFLETMDIELLEGREFDRSHATDTVNAIMINETFAKQLGPEVTIGSTIDVDSPNVQIIGIMRDFNFRNLSEPIAPLSLTLNPDFPLQYILVKVAPGQIPQTMAFLEKTWAEVAPGVPFEGSFLNENTERLYRDEKTMSQIFSAAAVLTILLSCLGLFAMAVLMVTQRTKEIGIRKVLGASPMGIVGLLSRRFTTLVVIATILASPLAWYAMQSWLEHYEYRIDISWWVFVLAGLAATAIALLTVSMQSLRAALANPVKSLRSE